MSRRLPGGYSIRSMRGALNDAELLWSAFEWDATPEGHYYWESQAIGELTEEGRAILAEMIALAEAEQAAAA